VFFEFGQFNALRSNCDHVFGVEVPDEAPDDHQFIAVGFILIAQGRDMIGVLIDVSDGEFVDGHVSYVSDKDFNRRFIGIERGKRSILSKMLVMQK
jgi:hypothetical protein